MRGQTANSQKAKKHRLYHCCESRQEVNNMSDVLRSSEMKGRSLEEDWKCQLSAHIVSCALQKMKKQ